MDTINTIKDNFQAPLKDKHLKELNDRYAIPFKLRFVEMEAAEDGGLISAEITNPHATASICLQGGQVLSWQPVNSDGTNQQAVIWMSPDAQFASGKSIRGGIPVCWPWFGAHSSDSVFPAHGFARTQPWQVKSTRSLDDGSTEISLTLPITTAMQAMWPHQAQLDMLVNVGETLKIALITRNMGDADFTITEALHTYFAVSSIAQIEVNGLHGAHFHDKAAGWTEGDQTGVISFGQEVDRVYVNTPARCTIVDTGFKRNIHISKLGSQSTVVWNPWAARAAQMGDLGTSGWKRFVCVESANALSNAVTVAAGKAHTLAVEYRVEMI
jgi:D-hexose-6-phosphate mutarotase